MKSPVVGRRVWVHGCADEYIVAAVDFNSGFATIARVQDKVRLHQVPICLLQVSDEIGEACTRATGLSEILDLSSSLVRSGLSGLANTRQTAELTSATIAKTKKKIEESDQNIERWRRLGCPDHSGDGDTRRRGDA